MIVIIRRGETCQDSSGRIVAYDLVSARMLGVLSRDVPTAISTVPGDIFTDERIAKKCASVKSVVDTWACGMESVAIAMSTTNYAVSKEGGGGGGGTCLHDVLPSLLKVAVDLIALAVIIACCISLSSTRAARVCLLPYCFGGAYVRRFAHQDATGIERSLPAVHAGVLGLWTAADVVWGLCPSVRLVAGNEQPTLAGGEVRNIRTRHPSK